MQVSRDTGGKLVLTYDSSTSAKWLFAVAAAFLVVAGYDYFVSGENSDRMIGLLLGTGICAVAGLALYETACTRVDLATNTIMWTRHIALWRRTGTLKFNEVSEVIVEYVSGTRKVPSQRISLRLANGNLLPLTYGGGPDYNGDIARAAAMIRDEIGLKST